RLLIMYTSKRSSFAVWYATFSGAPPGKSSPFTSSHNTSPKQKIRLIFSITLLLRLPVLPDFAIHEIHAPFQLVHAVHTVFNTDPAIKMDCFQGREDGIVIIESFADFAMPQHGGISFAVIFHH